MNIDVAIDLLEEDAFRAMLDDLEVHAGYRDLLEAIDTVLAAHRRVKAERMLLSAVCKAYEDDL